MIPAFWQCLLAADLSPSRQAQVLDRISREGLDPLAALRSPGILTTDERRRLDRADMQALERALAAGVTVLERPEMPETLLEAPGCPPALFVHGDTAALQQPMIAIVGTRAASTYGKAAARRFGYELARSGVTVVSGGALGIDAAAHDGALEAEGRSIAVMATGADIDYPPSNAPILRRLRERGCTLSQFPCGAPSLEFRFPIRNYLIAALSLGVLVIEAPQKSGSLITTTAAAELGRQVFVVPATINMESFRGSHALIRDGASLVDHPDQILEALGIEPVRRAETEISLSDVQRAVLGSLTASPQPPEALVASLGLEPSVVLAELTVLELEGVIVRDAQGYAAKP